MTVRGWKLAPLALLLTACGGPSGGESQEAQASAAMAATTTEADAALPTMLVYKTEFCGCCNGWVDHLREAGFEVDTRDVVDLTSVKVDAGVPADLSSCHTGIVDGYVVEGHVPADVVKQLLAERPEVTGISVPGMPIGSPGMEGPDPEPYEVVAFDRSGARSTFAEVDPR